MDRQPRDWANLDPRCRATPRPNLVGRVVQRRQLRAAAAAALSTRNLRTTGTFSRREPSRIEWPFVEPAVETNAWLRCYRCWSTDLEIQVHYEGIHKIDPSSGERAEVIDELQEAVVQCLECMHDQPHLAFRDGRVEPIEDRWERMVTGTPWVASCAVTVSANDVESCSGPEAGDALSYAAFGDNGTREFFTHVRYHKHDEDSITIHLLVELYARSMEEATEVLTEATRGTLAISSLAEESRPPATGDQPRH